MTKQTQTETTSEHPVDRARRETVSLILRESGAIITGSHVVYNSGKHGRTYVNKDAVYAYPSRISQLCRYFAHLFDPEGIDTVIGPALGGIVLSQWTAYHMTRKLEERNAKGVVISTFAEKEGDDLVIKRGYDKHITGGRILIVEDVLTTGGSVKKVIEAVRAIDGNIVGIGALCNRGGVTAKALGVPVLHALIDVDLETWPENECPLCKQGVAINTQVGKGREYLARVHREA